MTYDPAFTNTASCKSRITFIDGDKGILNYRGYPIEELAEKSNYLETAYLHPARRAAHEGPVRAVGLQHHPPHDGPREHQGADGGVPLRRAPHGHALLDGGRPLHLLPRGQAGPRRARAATDQILRLIAKIPTLAAFAYRHSQGLPYAYPDNDLSYCGNFLQMMFKVGGPYKVNPVLEKALEVLFILHADHEQNCSTSAMRGVGSSDVDPYSAIAAAIAALYGPLHGGANEAVLRMLEEIGSKDKVPAFIKDVKTAAAKCALMGFGHRVYKNYDPRARIIKQVAYEVFEVTGRNPLPRHRPRARAHRPGGRVLREAQALPQRGLLLRPDLPVAGLSRGPVPRALRHPAHSGWLAQWDEMQTTKSRRSPVRGRCTWVRGRRDYVPLEKRS